MPCLPHYRHHHYLTNGGKLEITQRVAGHADAKTTDLYGRRIDDVSAGEVEGGIRMELSAYEIACIAGGFTVIGALVGTITTFWCALELAKRNSRREAGRRLREAFHAEQAALDASLSENIGVEEILKKGWPRQNAAVSEMMFHLPPKDAAALDEAWRKYYLLGGRIHFGQYQFQGSREELRTMWNNRVTAILKFTSS